MKRTRIFFILLAMASLTFSEEIVPGKHYTLEKVEALEGYITLYDISITGRQLIILGEELTKEKSYKQLKMAVLSDSNGNFLDAIGLYRLDVSAVNEDSICFYGQFLESKTSRIVYVNQFSDSISLFDVDKWVADIFTTKDYIIYSTDYANNTIKRISLATGEITSYEGYYPNANLYPLTDDQYIGYFEHFSYEGQQFVLTDTEILKAEKYYPPVTVLRLSDFKYE